METRGFWWYQGGSCSSWHALGTWYHSLQQVRFYKLFLIQSVGVNFICFGSLLHSLTLTKFPSTTGMPCCSTVKPCSLTLKILMLNYSKVFHHSVDLCKTINLCIQRWVLITIINVNWPWKGRIKLCSSQKRIGLKTVWLRLCFRKFRPVRTLHLFRSVFVLKVLFRFLSLLRKGSREAFQ